MTNVEKYEECPVCRDKKGWKYDLQFCSSCDDASKNSFVLQTKKAMGFCLKTSTCTKCKFSVETENPFLDRSWSYVCTYSPLFNFAVESTSFCTKYEKRVNS